MIIAQLLIFYSDNIEMENINDEQPRIRNLYSLVPRYIGKLKSLSKMSLE